MVMIITGGDCNNMQSWKNLCEKNLWFHLWDKYGATCHKNIQNIWHEQTNQIKHQNMSALGHFQMRECITGNLSWNTFFASSPSSLEIFWNIFASSPPPFEICKGQKIENTRPTLILILRKKENPQSTNSFSSIPQYLFCNLYTLQNRIQYSHHC